MIMRGLNDLKTFDNLKQTFTFELDNMESMLIQTELTVMAGDHES